MNIFSNFVDYRLPKCALLPVFTGRYDETFLTVIVF